MRTHLLVFSIIITLSHQRSIKEFGEDENSNGCHCNWRLLRHYEAKGCQATAVDNCNCPVRFDCPKANEIEENDKACHYKGIYYAAGSVINTTNPCESCRCTKGAEARIVCSSIKCINLHAPLEPGCHFLYDDTECCPSKIICDRYGSLEDQALTCEYEGKKYPLGARMFSSTDPCEICFCTKEWNKSKSSCYQEDCILEKYKEKLMDGCVPIYAEDVCCPTEFYCAPDDVFLSQNEQAETSMEKTDSQCRFGNKYYDIGKSLSISQGSTFVTCTCQVPPDFTCLHKVCAPNPNENLCLPYFTSDDCCPKYDCLLGTEPLSAKMEGMTEREVEDEGDSFNFTNLENPCLDIKCTEGRSCMMYQVTCSNDTCPAVPICMKTNASCPTPQCASGCVVTEQDVNRCPTCVCGDDMYKRAAEMVKCSMPRCFGESCYFVAGEDGCPTCVCRRSCAIPECLPDCNVISENEGECPKCVCEKQIEGCPTPLCENESCRIGSIDGGCPTCICDRAFSYLPAETNGELEMEGSHHNSETVNFQFPQQQQQQDFDLPAGSPFDSQSSSDDYDEISVMKRRSPPAETKTYTKNAADAQKEAESKIEHKTSIKNGSSIGNSLNTTLQKGDREP